MSIVSQINDEDSKQLMPPPAPRPNKRSKVELYEEQYQAVLRSLIQRDYFPETQKMLNKVEWLRAQRSGNAETINMAQINIAKRNAGIHIPLLGEPAKEDVEELLQGLCPPDMSLSAFLNKFTSEDNTSFEAILERDVQSKRIKYSHLLKPPQNQKLLLPPSQHRTDGFGTGNQDPYLIKYLQETDKNALFYDASQQKNVELTETELAEQVQGPPKKIVTANTRFVSTSENNSDGLPETPSTDLNTPVLPQKFNLNMVNNDGDHIQAVGQIQRSQQNMLQYNYIPSPSPAPGKAAQNQNQIQGSDRLEDASPFMTWGQIAATPIRIDPEEDQTLLNAGPQFRVPDTSIREKAANNLARKAGQSLRRKEASQGVAPLLRNLKSPMSVENLSEAGIKLAQKMGKIKGLKDESCDELGLRASYSGTPRSAITSSRRTPKTSSVIRQPK